MTVQTGQQYSLANDFENIIETDIFFLRKNRICTQTKGKFEMLKS